MTDHELDWSLSEFKRAMKDLGKILVDTGTVALVMAAAFSPIIITSFIEANADVKQAKYNAEAAKYNSQNTRRAIRRSMDDDDRLTAKDRRDLGLR